MSETAAARCPIEEVFDPGFIELLRLAPRNPHVRALILKFTGKVPGPECGTFEEIREWVETNCKPRTGARRRNHAEGGILVPVNFSEREHGRADYSVRCSGRAEFRVTAAELLELAQVAVDDGAGMDEIVERVAEKIDEDAWNQCEPDMESDGEYDYSNHDANGTDDSETSYAQSDIRRAVLDFLREHHPELAGQL